MAISDAERKNYAEIERLEGLLQTLRESASTARETEAIREIGIEIALAVREVGAMLITAGGEQRDPTSPSARRGSTDASAR
jgi:hypothetical protein